MTEAVRKQDMPAGNLSTGLLKLIALVFMFIDHSGKVLFNNCQEMRIIGRIAFPIYVWCMVVGFCRTRNVTRYILRVLLVGFISQPLYLFALDSQTDLGVLFRQVFEPLTGGFSLQGLWEVLFTVFLKKPNIFLTLALGLIALCAVRERDWLRKAFWPGVIVLSMAILDLIHDGTFSRIGQAVSAPFVSGFSFAAVLEALCTVFLKAPNYFLHIIIAAGLLWMFSGKGRRAGQVWGPAAVMLLAGILSVDYGWEAILFFILLWAVRGSRPAIASVVTAYFLFWGARYQVTPSLFGEKVDLAFLPSSLSAPLSRIMRMEGYGLLALPLILVRIPWKFRMPKWLGYGLYPLHLVILIVLKLLIFGVKIS